MQKPTQQNQFGTVITQTKKMKDAEAKQQIHRTRCDSRARMTLARKRVPFSIRDYLTAVEKDGEKKKNKGKRE